MIFFQNNYKLLKLKIVRSFDFLKFQNNSIEILYPYFFFEMWEYKPSDDQINNKNSISKTEIHELSSNPSKDESTIIELNQLILAFYESFNKNEISQMQDIIKGIESLLSTKNKKLFNFIISNTDLLRFISIQLNSPLPGQTLSCILNLTRIVLFTNNSAITQILYENKALDALNNYINCDLSESDLQTVLSCIGYATYDIFELNLKPIFNISSDQFIKIMDKYPDLNRYVSNLLSNSLFCMKDNDLIIKTILFYIQIIDLDICSIENIVHLLRCIIAESTKKKIAFIFYEKKLFDILTKIFVLPRFIDRIVSNINEDVFYWTIKLFIVFLNRDDDHDTFLKSISLINGNDYYNLITSSSTTTDTEGEVFHLLTLLLPTNYGQYILKALIDYSSFKSGTKNLFDYNSYFEIQPFKIKVWYLRFLSAVISKSDSFDVISHFYTQEFIDLIISFLDPENIDMSESVLLTVLAMLNRAIKENHLCIIVFLSSNEIPFNDYIDQFCDDTENENLKDLGAQVIQTFSEAETAYIQRGYTYK